MVLSNVSILTALDAEYGNKLINKAVAQYLSTKLYVSRKKSTTQVKQHQYGSSSEDLFLPTIRKQTTTSDHLKDEDYLEIGEDETESNPEDSEDESSSSDIDE